MLMRIGGQEVGSGSGTWLDVINPSTGEVLDRVPARRGRRCGCRREGRGGGTRGMVGGRLPRERGKILFHAAEAVRAVHGDLARTLTRRTGKAPEGGH